MEKFIIFLPLFAAIISGFFGKIIGNRASQITTSLFVSVSALLSIYVFYDVISTGYSNNILIAKWINSGLLDVNWSIKIDQLSAVMLVVVTLVSAIVPRELETKSISSERRNGHFSSFNSPPSTFEISRISFSKVTKCLPESKIT